MSARQVPPEATAPGRADFEEFFNCRNRHKIIRIKRISSLLKMAMLIYDDTLVARHCVAVESSKLQVRFALYDGRRRDRFESALTASLLYH